MESWREKHVSCGFLCDLERKENALTVTSRGAEGDSAGPHRRFLCCHWSQPIVVRQRNPALLNPSSPHSSLFPTVLPVVPSPRDLSAALQRLKTDKVQDRHTARLPVTFPLITAACTGFSLSYSLLSIFPPSFLLDETHAVIPSHSHTHRGLGERQEQNTGLADWRRILFFFPFNEKELEKRHCKIKNVIAFLCLLSFLFYCMLFATLSLPRYLSPYLSFSAFSRPLESKWFQLWEEMNGWYLFLFPPLCLCCFFDAACNRQRGKAEALQCICPRDSSLQSMKHARQRRGRQYGGSDTDRELWYSDSSEQEQKENVRQGEKKMGGSVTWRKRVSSSGLRHFSNRRYTPFPIITKLWLFWCSTAGTGVTGTSICVKLRCKWNSVWGSGTCRLDWIVCSMLLCPSALAFSSLFQKSYLALMPLSLYSSLLFFPLSASHLSFLPCSPA